MKRIIITGGGDQHELMARITVPTLLAYAKRIGADFCRLHDSELERKDIHKWWIKTKMHDAFEAGYDEVAWIDIDCIVHPNCPSLFEYAEGMLTWFPESTFFQDRCEWFHEYCWLMGNPEVAQKWDGKYYNGGVMVIPRHAAAVVQLPSDAELVKTEAMIRTHPKTFWSDQNWFNFQAAKLGIESRSLPLAFDYMPFDNLWDKRHEAGIIHYAGLLACRGDALIDTIKDDLRKWGVDCG
jgi:hypothetical protein